MKRCSERIFYRRGFSLAEVLIVVAILVVLATISIPLFVSQSKEAKRNADIDNYNNACHSAISAYYARPMDTITYIYDASTGMVLEYVEDGFVAPEGYGLSKQVDWNGQDYYNMGPNFPCSDDGELGFVVVQFVNGDMSAWWQYSIDTPSNEEAPETSGAPLNTLETIVNQDIDIEATP